MIADLKSTCEIEKRQAQVSDFNKANKWKKRGMALVPICYSVHNMAFSPMPYYCHISIFEGDGSISICHGGIEMGQGINTKVAQTVAKEFNVPMEIVRVKVTFKA